MAKTNRRVNKHPRNLRKSRARCLCGLRSTLHYTTVNRKLTCAEAAELHRYAGIEFKPLRTLLVASIGAR